MFAVLWPFCVYHVNMASTHSYMAVSHVYMAFINLYHVICYIVTWYLKGLKHRQPKNKYYFNHHGMRVGVGNYYFYGQRNSYLHGVWNITPCSLTYMVLRTMLL